MSVDGCGLWVVNWLPLTSHLSPLTPHYSLLTTHHSSLFTIFVTTLVPLRHINQSIAN